MGRTFGFMIVAAVCCLVLTGCSGGGGAPAPVSYSGDPVVDFVAAIQSRDTAKVRALLDADPTLIELRDEQGQSPLHYAALHNGAEIIDLLVERGIDPNVRDNAGNTALSALEDSGFRYDDTREALIDNGGTN